jgi:enolase-phosphatase E1
VTPPAILLDIEGTTTPISFVYETLFPFARAHAEEFLDADAAAALEREYQADAAAGRQPPEWEPGALRFVHWLMDHDRKSTALKALQGRIWEGGYRGGQLIAQVFADVPPALRRWRKTGVDVRIYSSGSVLAQKLLFAHSDHGDLTPLLGGYFDTTTGPKLESASYAKIAAAMGLAPSHLLFVSDVAAELDAAGAAGLQVLLAIRPGNAPQPERPYRQIRDFGEI